MNCKKFAEMLETRNEEAEEKVGRPFLARAFFEAILKSEPGSPPDIERCFEYARDLAARAELEAEGMEEPTPLERGAQVSVDAALEEISDEVKALRKELFGSEERPFDTWDDAYAWIESEVEKISLVPRDQKQGEELYRREKEHIRNRCVYLDLDLRLRPVFDLFEYYQKVRRDYVRRCTGVPMSHPTLFPLTKRVAAWSRRTDIAFGLLLFYFFCDVRVNIAISVEISETISGPKLPTTKYMFAGTSPSRKDCERTHKFARKLRGNIKELSSATNQLLAVITQLGGVPEKGKMAFWEQVPETLHQCFKTTLTAKACRMRFSRLRPQLQANYQRGEA